MGILALPPSGPLNTGRAVDLPYKITANDVGSVDTLTVPATPLLLTGVRIMFDPIATPNSLSFPINTPDGIAIVASQTLVASGVAVLPQTFVQFSAGMVIPFTGNTTPGGIFTITLSVIPG